jgi:hypothetical protein
MDKRGYPEKWKRRKYLLRDFVAGLIVFCLFVCPENSFSQELFPTVEPASTMPKKLFGFRQINEMYKDINGRGRYYSGLRLMYGATKKLTLMTMIGASNHHFKRIPTNLSNYIINHHRMTYPSYPFLAEGIHVYAKYRFVNFDSEQKHFRIAAYSEATKSFVAHTEGESSLMTDNSGYGGGLIFTRLYKRFAASVTWGFIKSLPYRQKDKYQTIKFKSGDVVMYNVAFGYRLYPKVYDSYKDVNINLYAEFINKSYSAAKIYYDNVPYDYEFLKNGALYTYNGFIANRYCELRSSVQFIFDSNSRLDIGAAVPIYHRSYLHDYPLIFVNIQKYLFR